MSRKHFQLIADVVKNISDKNERERTAQEFVGRLQAENPRFDTARFLKACGC